MVAPLAIISKDDKNCKLSKCNHTNCKNNAISHNINIIVH